jgi:chromatin remodeling complex protein RSC6
MKPEHYQMLAEAKMTVEQIGVVMRIMAEAEDAMKVAEEARKSVARERVQRWREKQKDAVTLPKLNGNATVRLTRVEDSSSKKDISGKEEKKEGRSQATRLPADWTIPNDWLQDALRAGMDIPQALASAARMHNWSLSDTKGKKLDWRATWRNWFQRDLPKPHSTASPDKPKKQTLATMWHDEARQHGIIDDPSSPSNGRVVPSLPAGQNQSPGVARRYAGT